ncbi:2-dehydro-3-deoxy-6-phosphogalactonate aldolase [Solilutibacter silvestris]|uniref:2-dehydro-3-deoxy-6-phosphogalactonate aldolase n=1 Tax=Solilutibacter silvestris TaxID=1645665 RepID=UPI003D333EAB
MSAEAIPFRLPLIAILRGITPDEALSHARALVEEGWDAIEIPTNSPGWNDSVARLAREFPRDICIGAGTVLTTAQVDALVDAGGTLVVTPNTRPSVIAHAVARGLHVAAGVATPSEAFDALDAGARMLKLFPASVYGPAMASALRSVLPPSVPLFAVGGITPDALPRYLAAGCAGAGIGGDLYKSGQSVERTRAQARAFRQAWLDHAG